MRENLTGESEKKKKRTTGRQAALTGEGELGQRHVAVHAVVDEAEAHALGSDLHPRDQLRWQRPGTLLVWSHPGR